MFEIISTLTPLVAGRTNVPDPDLKRMTRFSKAVCVAIAVMAYCVGGSFPAFGASADPAAASDFIAEARLLYRMAACAGEEPIPRTTNIKVVKQHCLEFETQLRKYQEQYLRVMKPFIAENRPENLPSTVVYPFGGADLLTALMTYPDAEEIYTLSLEHAGDIRNIGDLGTVMAHRELSAIRQVSAGPLGAEGRHVITVSTNGELMAMQRGGLRMPITLFLVALAAHGQEPVSLRYFKLDEGGSIHYLDDDDIAKREAVSAKALAENWNAPDFSSAFSHYELRFKPVGQPGPIRVHRHIAANLANSSFSGDSALYGHLAQKGQVAALVKGGLRLLWRDEFSNIRDYLIDRAALIIADSSGPSPLHALPAGLSYQVFGRYEGAPADEAEKPHDEALIEFFQQQPYRPLPASYGYSDRKQNASMLVIRRKGR